MSHNLLILNDLATGLRYAPSTDAVTVSTVCGLFCDAKLRFLYGITKFYGVCSIFCSTVRLRGGCGQLCPTCGALRVTRAGLRSCGKMVSAATGGRAVGVGIDVDEFLCAAFLAAPLQVVAHGNVGHAHVKAHVLFVAVPPAYRPAPLVIFAEGHYDACSELP